MTSGFLSTAIKYTPGTLPQIFHLNGHGELKKMTSGRKKMKFGETALIFEATEPVFHCYAQYHPGISN